MDFDIAVKTINTLLDKEQPESFSSSWIFTHSYNALSKTYALWIDGVQRGAPSSAPYSVQYGGKIDTISLADEYGSASHQYFIGEMTNAAVYRHSVLGQ
ncbi:MAG: hypothetical protein KGI45_00820 [Patescibacteria group bacterium]|nr:hypothetical protein [Patescibacteria group bacterium]MDE1940818.1 hypothetical protein [Patescibacteria group bacterium]MDE1966599.1 hypothetical protein [Patescibacteria group bacterium]